MGKYIRHFIGVLVGFVIGAIVQFMGSRWGVTFEDQDIKNLTDALTNMVSGGVMLLFYAFSEKYLKRFHWLDPEGFAGRQLVKREAARMSPPMI